jgi:DNA-binding MarR family transcriptional regulator
LQRFRIIIRTAQQHSHWIEKQTGITGAQLWALQELQDSPAMRVGDLANRMALHQSTASNLLDRLETQGLVTRSRPDADQRVVRVSLSPSGRKKLAAAPKPARGVLPEVLNALDLKALADLQDALDGVLQKMQSGDPSFALKPLPFTDDVVLLRGGGDDVGKGD